METVRDSERHLLLHDVAFLCGGGPSRSGLTVVESGLVLQFSEPTQSKASRRQNINRRSGFGGGRGEARHSSIGDESLILTGGSCFASLET
ncbi:hypothetical protein Bca101_057315 [Brassica carinata]